MGICVSKKERLYEDGHHCLQHCYAGEGEDERSVGSAGDDQDNVILVDGGGDDVDPKQQLYSYNVLFDKWGGAKVIESGSRRWQVVRVPRSSSSDHDTVELCELTSDCGGHHHNHGDDDLLSGRALHSKRIYGDLSFSSYLLSAKHPAAPRAFHDHGSSTRAAAIADSSTCTIAPHHNYKLPHLAADVSSLEQQLDAAVRECYHPGHNDDHVSCLNSLGGGEAAAEYSSWIPVLSVQESSSRQERVLSIRLEKCPAACAGLALAACEAGTPEGSTTTTTTTTTEGAEMMQIEKMMGAASATAADRSSSYIGDGMRCSSVLSQSYYQPSSLHGAASRNYQRTVGSGEIGVFGAERYFNACDQREREEELAAMDLAVMTGSCNTPSRRPLSTSSLCSTSAAAEYGVGQLLQLADQDCNDSSSNAMSSSWQQYRNSTAASSDVSSYDSRSALSGATRRKKNAAAVLVSSSDAGIWSFSPSKGTHADVAGISRAGAAEGRGGRRSSRAVAAAAALCSGSHERSRKESSRAGCAKWSVCSGRHALADALSCPARRRSTQVQDHDHHTPSSPSPASAVVSRSKKKGHVELQQLQHVEPINNIKQDQPMSPSAKLASFLGLRRQLLADIKSQRDQSNSPNHRPARNSGAGTYSNGRTNKSTNPRQVISNSSSRSAERHPDHPPPISDIHHRKVLNQYPSMPSPSSYLAPFSDITSIAVASYAYDTSTLTKANGELTPKHYSQAGPLSPPYDDQQPALGLGSFPQKETAQAGAELGLNSGNTIVTSGLQDYCRTSTTVSTRASEDASVPIETASLAGLAAFGSTGKEATRYRSVRPFELAFQHRGEELARMNQQLNCTSSTANLMDESVQKGAGAVSDCLRKHKPLTQLMLTADQEKLDSTCQERQQEELRKGREDSKGSDVISSLSMSAAAGYHHGSDELLYHETMLLQQQHQFERGRLSFTFPSLVSLPPPVVSLQVTSTADYEMSTSDSRELYNTARSTGNIHVHDSHCSSNYNDHGGGISTSNSTSPSGASTPTGGGRSHSAFGSPFSVAACPSADYRKREELLIKRLRAVNSSEVSTATTASYWELARSNNDKLHYHLQSSSSSSSTSSIGSANAISNHGQSLKDKPAAILPQQQTVLTSSSHASSLTLEYELDSDSSSDLFDLESLATDHCHHQPPGLSPSCSRCAAEFPVFEVGRMMMESEDTNSNCVNMMAAASSNCLVDYYLSSYENSVAMAHCCYTSNDMNTHSGISNSTTRQAYSSLPLKHDVEEKIIKQTINSIGREQCSHHDDERIRQWNIEPERASISAVIRRRLSLLS